jgi:uncharacterized protein (TIGR00725 family)
MKITIFGGTLPKQGDSAYLEGVRLGSLLAQAGHTVITGGYMGTMEAVSKGAAEEGGHVVGVTCDEIERWRGNKPNPWVKEEWKIPTLHERMITLMDSCDSAMALPGGVGTLAEITLLWDRMLVQATPVRPLILIGAGWQATFSQLFGELSAYFPLVHQKMLLFAPTVEIAVGLLKE